MSKWTKWFKKVNSPSDIAKIVKDVDASDVLTVIAKVEAERKRCKRVFRTMLDLWVKEGLMSQSKSDALWADIEKVV